MASGNDGAMAFAAYNGWQNQESVSGRGSTGSITPNKDDKNISVQLMITCHILP